ncbi:MAG TPA: hypothetical protein VLZ77_11390 [Acidimicrobiales bacterium]|nr:hypothetical protein [Acidimicrobiales bacterium]
MVWGRPGPPRETADTAAGAVRAARAALGLAGAAALTLALVVVVGLGPTWPVVAAAALGTAAAAAMARAPGRAVVAAAVLVGLAGLAWIELVDEVQYGTLALSGAPPLVRWCGTTYRPDGMSATRPGATGLPAYSEVLRTPSGHDVYGVAPRAGRPCAAGGVLFVQAGPGRYLVYGPSG